MILRSELKQNAKNQLKNNWFLAIGIIIVCQLIAYIPNLLLLISDNLLFATIIIPIIILVITALLSIGQCKFFINLANKSNPKFSDLRYGLNNILRAIGVTLLVGVIVFIGILLFIIPGIILAYMYSQVYYIMAENPDMNVLDVLKESSRIMNGRKFEIFVLQLSFIGWIILTVITFGIAGLYVFPYYNVTLTNFYLNIKN